MPYYVYIILCEDETFYTGYTKNLDSRVKLHANGKGARYTRAHKPRKLVYVEKFRTITDAMKKERKIKGLSHLQKLQLINDSKDQNPKREK
ncbi:MAG TPA: GIY-YIG nuclease family protein [Candidatus Acidoferrum sp.]|jgi:putative endonuclease|nr:GIY-YIG nuclease family protein [Candidatus Acidoferrum sp.]